MNDLLGGVGPSKGGNDYGDMEDPLVEGGDAGDDVGMKQFFEEVGEIKNCMAIIRRHLHKLQDDNEESKLVTRAPAMKELKKRMQDEINSVTKVARQIKGMVERLDKSNMENRRLPNCQEGSSTDRTRTSITNSLKKKLKEIMDEFNELRTRLADEYKETVERRYYTVTGEKPDEAVVDQMIDSGDAEAIFRKAIQEQGRGQVLDTLKEIEERHDAVKEIEKQLLELHQIFMDMASLVESQGELLDNIENNVGTAVEHVQSGNKMLVKARELQKNTRKVRRSPKGREGVSGWQ
eukprot:TRINITY_DN890_c0_g1_i1.p1 TRINITY_DN890_c0_g1~~TRINITY_DN890_c0_g1_i1.p1  ORF type:complete len:293 (-),score=79.07 TRINITY_DN890_c0_g1_i1:457-1335(-)